MKVANHVVVALLVGGWLSPSSTVRAGEERTASGVALLVNGEAVSPAELRWFAQRERTGVIQLCESAHGVRYGPGFWTRNIRGKTPRLLLREKSIARATREKVEQMLFRELGLTLDISYGALLANLERTNRERGEAVRRGRVVYGPVNFTLETFYEHQMARMRIRAKALLGQDRLVAKDDELETNFQSERERYRSPALSSWRFVEIPGGPDDVAPGRTSQSIDDVTEERLGEILGDGESVRKLRELRPGESVQLKRPAGKTLLAKCIARTPGDVRPFSEVRQKVAARWLDQQYDRLIASLSAAANVQIDPQGFDLISVE